MRRGVFAALIAAVALSSMNVALAEAPDRGTDSNLPVPRFVSLATEGANGRRGPGTEHQVDWVYQRAGLPLQVTAESGPWRRVRDPQGGETWMHEQNLASRRTVYVSRSAVLRRGANGAAQPLAYLAPGVIGSFTACRGEWRRVAIAGRVGWVRADEVWGGDCAGF